jgi:hypothetical protein
MDAKENICACFIKIGFNPNLTAQDFDDLDKIFTPYIWGSNGIDKALKQLKHRDYGNDLVLILFQFNIIPTPTELVKLKEIEPYRKTERAIGIPIIVTNDNFFNKPESGRYDFLKQSILHKLDLLSEVVKQKKLDTKSDLLKSDLEMKIDSIFSIADV